MEYERTVTTVASSYVKPVIGRYLANLEERLRDVDIKVLRSDGGLSSASVAKEHCANLLYSVNGVISPLRILVLIFVGPSWRRHWCSKPDCPSDQI